MRASLRLKQLCVGAASPRVVTNGRKGKNFALSLYVYRLVAVSRLVTCHKYVSGLRFMPPGCVVSKLSACVRVSPRVDHCRALYVPCVKYSSCVSALSSMCSAYNLLPNSFVNMPVKQFKRCVSDPSFLVPFLTKCPASFIEQLFL